MSPFYPPQGQNPRSSFDGLTREDIEAHVGIRRYGDFVLTDAVVPAYDLRIVPSEGYREDVSKDEQSGKQVSVLMGAASRHKLFALFMDLLKPMPPVVDVVLETSHRNHDQGHTDLFRRDIDLPVLTSTLYDFEDLLLHDGCTGIAVLATEENQCEVQFDEHKLLVVFGYHIGSFRRIFERCMRHRQGIKFINEAEHVHASSEEYYKQFQRLQFSLGAEQ